VHGVREFPGLQSLDNSKRIYFSCFHSIGRTLLSLRLCGAPVWNRLGKRATLTFQDRVTYINNNYVTRFGKTRLNALRVKFDYLQQ
jgi:hypothetical protein